MRELTCIGCPMGCMLTAETDAEGNIIIKGNTCPKGAAYGKNELTNPMRTVTSSVFVKNGELNKVSVKTEGEVPKKDIFACMEAIRKCTVEAPVHIGQVAIENVAGTGVNVIITKNCEVA